MGATICPYVSALRLRSRHQSPTARCRSSTQLQSLLGVPDTTSRSRRHRVYLDLEEHSDNALPLALRNGKAQLTLRGEFDLQPKLGGRDPMNRRVWLLILRHEGGGRMARHPPKSLLDNPYAPLDYREYLSAVSLRLG